MKIVTVLLVSIISSTIYGQEYYFINAESGLNVRSDSTLALKKVAKIPFGTLVEKVSDTDEYVTVTDNGKKITGKFVKIKYNNYLYLVSEETKPFEREGYVFDAYLKKQKSENIVSKTKIDETAYTQLLKKANKTIYSPKKIGNLDSIKTILKNRVEWVSEFKNEEYKRDDALKSITTNNGKKLMLNQASNDYGFSEGSSGYYPEEDILVLKGGHSSDMCFSIKTGETHLAIGNPIYIIPSPKGTYRLNGFRRICTSYFFQKKEGEKLIYLTELNLGEPCTLEEFYWINETEFIYKTLDYRCSQSEPEDGEEKYFKGEIKNNSI